MDSAFFVCFYSLEFNLYFICSWGSNISQR